MPEQASGVIENCGMCAKCGDPIEKVDDLVMHRDKPYHKDHVPTKKDEWIADNSYTP